MFDFGGVITSSPFEAFTRYEREAGLPDGFIRLVNSTDPDSNAWSRLERGQLDVDGFAAAFETEALRLGHRVDGRAVLGLLGGDIRPAMVEAVRHCTGQFVTACVTNNFTLEDAPLPAEVSAVFELFDVVVESRVAGIRKPDPAHLRAGLRDGGGPPRRSGVPRRPRHQPEAGAGHGHAPPSRSPIRGTPCASCRRRRD